MIMTFTTIGHNIDIDYIQMSPLYLGINVVAVVSIAKQEAPLTLRGQLGRCRNIKGEPQIYGIFPSPRPRPLFLWAWFYGGPWQTQAVYQI